LLNPTYRQAGSLGDLPSGKASLCGLEDCAIAHLCCALEFGGCEFMAPDRVRDDISRFICSDV